VLAAAAGQLAAASVLAPVPGWHSGLATAPPLEPARELRRRLWQALNGVPVRIPWYDGIRLELIPGNDVTRCLYIGGAIDPNEFAFLAGRLEPGMTVIDAGANEGLYSLFMSRRVGPKGKVLAIEPSARERVRLERNLALNRISNVLVVPAALGECDGSGLLRIAEAAHAGHNTLGRPAAPWVKVESEIQVPLSPLDRIAASEGLGRIHLIKLDVEGAELAALRGAEEVLRRDRPVLLLEFMPEALTTQGASAPALLEFLRERGYAFFDFSPASGKPVPLKGDHPSAVNIIAEPRAA